MKEEKPRLTLNKQTIAHLNNLEMINTRGGDGEELTSRVDCTHEAEARSIAKELAAIVLSKILHVCN
jgi:hypothetical protein